MSDPHHELAEMSEIAAHAIGRAIRDAHAAALHLAGGAHPGAVEALRDATRARVEALAESIGLELSLMRTGEPPAGQPPLTWAFPASADTWAAGRAGHILAESDRLGLLWLDECVAAILSDAESAAAVRARSADAWQSWRGIQPDLPSMEARRTLGGDVFRLFTGSDNETGLGYLVCAVAMSEWGARVRPAVEEDKFPALPLGVQRAHAIGTFGPGRVIEERDDGVVVVRQRTDTAPARDVARLDAAHTQTGTLSVPSRLLTQGLTASAGLATHRLFRWLPHQTREQVIRNRVDLTTAVPIIRVQGGIGELAESLGVGRRKASDLRAALDWLQHAHVIGGDGTEYHGLLTWSERKPGPGSPAEAEIIPSKALLLGGGRGKLTPVPHALPRFVGDRARWGAQAAMQLLTMDLMRERARELIEHGGVRVTAGEWGDLADQAGVSRRILDDVLDAWTSSGPASPAATENAAAFLAPTGPDRFTLAPAYAAELAELREGGRLTARAAKGGRARAAKRAGK